MTQTQTPNEFLFASGAPSFKFANPGDTVKGRILDLIMQQQRDPKTQAPKFWNDDPTQPMMQLRVTLQTELRDSSDPNDEGQRSIYVRGEMQKAIRDAVKVAGRTSIDEGGILTVRYEGDGAQANRALNPPKLYKARYEPPTQTVGADDF